MPDLPYGLSVKRRPDQGDGSYIDFAQESPKSQPQFPEVAIYDDGVVMVGDTWDIPRDALLTWARLLVEQLEEAQR